MSPTIQINATLSPNTLSLSSSTPSSPPIYLNLRVQLKNSSNPIRILLSSSALSQTGQSFYQSYYDLTSLSTGNDLRQQKVHGILAPRIKIQDPEKELLTLEPDGPPVDISIRIGIQVAPPYHERKEGGADTRPYLALAATQISMLEVGEEYEIGLKNFDGEMPASVWWWERGWKEDVVQRLEGKGFVVPVCGIDAGTQKPVLKIVE